MYYANYLPIVSIVVPCYNQGHFLHDALESIEAQTLKDFEIIVVDDGSTFPETLRILSELSSPRVRLVRTANQGLADARNNGISLAKSKYILPLDADDKIGPRYLEKAVEVLEKRPQIGIVYCQAEFFGARQGRWELPSYKFPDVLISPCIFASSVFRRADWERVGGFSNKMMFGWEDFDFWLSLIERGIGVYQIPEVLFFYRQHEHASMARKMDHDRIVTSFKTAFHRHRDLYINHIETLFSGILRQSPQGVLDEKRFCAQLFYPQSGGYSEEQSHSTLYRSDFWERLSFELPDSWAEDHNLRFDPSNGPAVLSVAELTIKSPTSGDIVWKASDREAFGTIEVSGTAMKLAHDDKLILLSYGHDPQIYLPKIDAAEFPRPLLFEVVIHGSW